MEKPRTGLRSALAPNQDWNHLGGKGAREFIGCNNIHKKTDNIKQKRTIGDLKSSQHDHRQRSTLAHVRLVLKQSFILVLKNYIFGMQSNLRLLCSLYQDVVAKMLKALSLKTGECGRMGEFGECHT